MNGGDRLRRRRSLQERLGLVCCGSTWGIGPSTMSIHGDDDDDDEDGDDNIVDPTDVIRTTLPESISVPDCVFPSPRMNLADALAAERQSRSTAVPAEDGSSLTPENENDDGSLLTTSLPRNSNSNNDSRTPAARVSLMRLLEETDDQDDKKEGLGEDLVCCVCMGRKKGAAFIPCGHTFCRVCSRELWLNRGSCPLCNRSILEILDIF